MEAVKDSSHLYEVERRARHAERPGFRISELQIGPRQQVPWHYHNNVQDTFYVLQGLLRLFLRDPKEELRLEPGETYTVRARRPHLVTNGGEVYAVFLVLQGLGAALAGNLIAIAAPSLGVFGLVFVMLGIQIAAMNVSNLNVMLEFAPGPAAQPTYVGLGTTLLAPIAFGAPIAAGLLADARGFVAVFVVAAVAACVALALLVTRVRDPRAAAVAPRAA